MTSDEILKRLPDRGELSRIAGIEIEDSDRAELSELLFIYQNRFRDDNDLPDDLFLDRQQDYWEGYKNPRRAEQDVRRTIVGAIAGVWTDCKGRGRGSYWDAVADEYTGGLLKLLESLFKIIESKPPSLATLHNDLKFLGTGRERHEGRRMRHPGP